MNVTIDNCLRCGQIYKKNFRGLCKNCMDSIDSELQRVVSFLKRHPNITIEELSDNVEVSIKRITKFIKENKILIYDYPNLKYKCIMCVNQIRKREICDNCSQRVNREIKALFINENIYEKDEEYIKRDSSFYTKDSVDKYIVKNKKKS